VNPDEPASPSQGRKPYEKPTLSQVSLRPEEAVLGSCKTMGGTGPASASDCGMMMGGCATMGS
jgi:hypothetical protein